MNTIKEKKIIASTNQIKNKVGKIANKINSDYKGMSLDIICLTNSAMIFCSDLVRELTIPVNLHLFAFQSYLEGNETGEVKIILDINQPLANRHLLVVEGIIVSGRTPKYIIDLLKIRQPASIALCALGIKPKLLTEKIPLKYFAFELRQEIAVGYGIGKGEEKCSPDLLDIS